MAVKKIKLGNIPIFKVVVVVLGVIFIILLSVWLVYLRSRIDRFLDMKAVDICAGNYRLEFTEEGKGTKIIRPLDEPMKECVWQLGVRNWMGTK